MSDALDRMVARIRTDDVEFGKEYDIQRARAAFVTFIVKARKAKGWTQRDLAEKTGIKQPVIARFESGSTDPKLSTITRICNALDVQLFDGDDSAEAV